MAAFEGAKRTCAAVLAKRRAREAAARKRAAVDGSKHAAGDSVCDDGSAGAVGVVQSSGEALLALLMQQAPARHAGACVDDYTLLAFVRPFLQSGHAPNKDAAVL